MNKTAFGLVNGFFLLFTISGTPLASAADSCTGDFFGSAEVRYDDRGRLVDINDRIHHTRTELFYDQMYVSISQTGRTGFQNDSAEGGARELWGPSRWSLYNSKTGRLATVHTYEDHNYSTRQVQTSWEIPNGYDFTSATNPNGSVTYNGPFTQETVTYEQVKSGVRKLDIKEPLNIKTAQCLTVGGHSYSLRREASYSDSAPPAPFHSFATRVITGENAPSQRLGGDRYESGRFATKVIGASSDAASGESSSWASSAY